MLGNHHEALQLIVLTNSINVVSVPTPNQQQNFLAIVRPQWCMSYAFNGDSRGWEINGMGERMGWDGGKIAMVELLLLALGKKEGFPSRVQKSSSQFDSLTKTQFATALKIDDKSCSARELISERELYAEVSSQDGQLFIDYRN